MLAVIIWFVTLLTIGAAALTHSGVRQLARGLKDPDHPDAPIWLCRGLREVLLVICGTVIGIGYATGSTITMGVGAVILAEEMYECGVALWILESGRKDMAPELADTPV